MGLIYRSMKKGIIKIHDDFYRKRWNDVLLFLKDFKPYRIEHDVNDEIWIFYGVCDEFSEVQEGELLPEYIVNFTQREKNGEITYKFEKI